MALSTSPDALRVATPFGSAGKVGNASVQPAGQLAGGQPVEQRGAGRVAPAPASKAAVHSACGLAPRSPTCAGVREHLVVDLEGLVRVEAEEHLGGRDLVGAQRRPVRLAGVAAGWARASR